MEFGAIVGEADGGDVLIAVHGEIDVAVTDQLADIIAAAGAGGRVVHLDLREVGFIDAAGVQTLLRCGLALERGGGRLRIGGRSHQVARVLELTGYGLTNAAFDVIDSDGGRG